jgi:glycerol uptake facilitator-like aquaporin
MKNETIATAWEFLAKPAAYGVSGAAAFIPVAVAAASDSLSGFAGEQWMAIIVQSIGAFLFAIFLLWVWPQQMKFQREIAQDMAKTIKENNESNAQILKDNSEAQAKIVENLTGCFERHDTAWRDFMSKRGYCPVRDGHEEVIIKPKTHEPR